ncbi:MAG: hypothetical protein HY046_05615 [Acidobacteria bacterium]|nr:hypothetical protein [Acidobacteriota bacterium]
MCHRSRRRGLGDKFAHFAGFLPWRCQTCETRFRARAVALGFLIFVHCPNCGNLELDKVGRDRVLGGFWVKMQRWLHFPAYRCDACRTRFFSIRRFRPIVPTSYPEFGSEFARSRKRRTRDGPAEQDDERVDQIAKPTADESTAGEAQEPAPLDDSEPHKL